MKKTSGGMCFSSVTAVPRSQWNWTPYPSCLISLLSTSSSELFAIFFGAEKQRDPPRIFQPQTFYRVVSLFYTLACVRISYSAPRRVALIRVASIRRRRRREREARGKQKGHAPVTHTSRHRSASFVVCEHSSKKAKKKHNKYNNTSI